VQQEDAHFRSRGAVGGSGKGRKEGGREGGKERGGEGGREGGRPTELQASSRSVQVWTLLPFLLEPPSIGGPSVVPVAEKGIVGGGLGEENLDALGRGGRREGGREGARGRGGRCTRRGNERECVSQGGFSERKEHRTSIN